MLTDFGKRKKNQSSNGGSISEVCREMFARQRYFKRGISSNVNWSKPHQLFLSDLQYRMSFSATG